MAKKWDGSKVIKEIDEALDRATKQFLINTRSKLSAASPVLTGRLASSWNIGKNQPDLSAPPEREVKGPIALKPFPGVITYGGNWFISSNLPYTQRAAYDPYNGRRGGGDWFTRIENNLATDAERIFTRELSKIK
jgi:hypothetical protein